jgi:transcriptional regulator with XRE-family HTH domain
MQETTKELHRNIKRQREFKGLSSEQMADFLGISPRTYADLESGHTKIDSGRLVKIAEALGASVEQLLYLHEPSAQHNHLSVKEQHHCFIANNHVYLIDKGIYEDLRKNADYWRDMFLAESKARQVAEANFLAQLEAKDKLLHELMGKI